MFLLTVLFQISSLNVYANSLFQDEQVCNTSSEDLLEQIEDSSVLSVDIFNCNVFDEIHSDICWDIFNSSPV